MRTGSCLARAESINWSNSREISFTIVNIIFCLGPHSLFSTMLGQVLVGRIDADAERTLLGDVLGGFDAATQLPVMAFCTRKSKKAVVYEGPHERHAIVEFAHKQLGPPTTQLRSITEVENFVACPRFQATDTLPSTVVTVSRCMMCWNFADNTFYSPYCAVSSRRTPPN